MKQIFTLSFLLLSLAVFSQEKITDQQAPATQFTPAQEQSVAQQNARAGSMKARTKQPVPLPYDVDDKYMGRKNEFLYQMVVSELPSDFPLYRKEWGLTEYNAVIETYYINHKELLTKNTLDKITSNEKK